MGILAGVYGMSNGWFGLCLGGSSCRFTGFGGVGGVIFGGCWR